MSVSAPPRPAEPLPDTESGTAASGLPAAAVWRLARLPVIVAVLVLVGATFLAVYGSRYNRNALDPSSVGPQGSHALAALLQHRGVTVHRVHGASAVPTGADATSTVFLPFADYESPESLRRLTELPGTVRLVVVDPSAGALRVLTSEVSPSGGGPIKRHSPGCDDPVAQTAGDADIGGARFRLVGIETGRRCYGGSLVSARSVSGQGLVVVGAPDPFTNDRLAANGNAALSLGLLGAGDSVWWVLPGPAGSAGAGQRRSLLQVLPHWVGPVLWELALVFVLLALWRGRRLGPVVTEPLPVVVRAAETVEGRARLYRRARARDSTSDALRDGARARLVPFLGLGADPAPAVLVEAVAARTGRTPGEVGALLFGAAPSDDPSLVRLASQLDQLVRSALDREGPRL